MRATEYAVGRRLSTSAILVALVVLGLYGLWRLPVDFLPSITYPMIKVHIWWPGATPEEIEKNIADPMERQMATVDDLDYLESSSIEGMYTLLINFKYGVDINVAYQDALAAVARISRELPADMDPPVIIKADPSQLPVAQMTVSSDRWDLVRLRSWADEWLQDQLLAVEGVAGAEIVGGLRREIRVHLDPEALEKHDLSLTDVLERLRAENIEQFGGRVTVGPREIIARTMGEYRSLEDIRSIPLIHTGLSRLYLRDVAEVTDAHEEARVITRLNGNSCVKLSILKQSTANTVRVARGVEQRITELLPELPEGITLGVVENQAEYISAALNGVRNTALGAALLVILIVWLFLGSWRQVLVVAVSLPLTLVLNFGLMKLAGFSLNIFSMGGLVIAIGVLVDNSILVIENITRNRRIQPETGNRRLVVDSVAEIGPAMVAATLSFLALFVPFLLVPGLVSLLFRELILVIAGIVLISLAMAVTVTPMIASLIVGTRFRNRGSSLFERFFEHVTRIYGWLLEYFIAGRWIVLACFSVLLAVTVWLSGRLGTEFLPQMDDGRIMVKVRLPTGAALEETNQVLAEIEKRIGQDDRIDSLFTMSGGKVWGLYTYEIANEGELNIQLVPRDRRDMSTEAFVQKLRPIVSGVPIPGGRAMVMQMKVKGIRKLGDADIEVKIRGQDLDGLFDMSRKTADAMRQLESFVNVHVSMDMTRPEYQIQMDRQRAADLGVSVSDIADTVRTLISGAVPTRYRDNEEYYNIRVMVSETEMVSRKDVENLPLRGGDGGFLRLSDVATVDSAVGPVEIVRENQIKQVIVRGDVHGASVGQALVALRQKLDSLEKPIGFQVSYGGQAQMMTEMQHTVLWILGFAVFFAFIVLAVQFNNIQLPSLILGSIPFCLSGLVLAMLWTQMPLGATVIIGVLVIVSTAVNDGVLLLTFANELQNREDLSASVAVVKAAKIRFRPRVMTTLSTLIGFTPLALAIEEGGDMLQPMAIAAIGGLLMEIPVALFLMPCLYVIASRRRPREK